MFRNCKICATATKRWHPMSLHPTPLLSLECARLQVWFLPCQVPFHRKPSSVHRCELVDLGLRRNTTGIGGPCLTAISIQDYTARNQWFPCYTCSRNFTLFSKILWIGKLQSNRNPIKREKPCWCAIQR